MGIICKTQKQAEDVYARVQSREHKIYLLSPESAAFVKGVVICTAHMAKGLEFDHVIVPDATDRNYNSIIDKSMLYVACTRAMHKLTVTGVKRMTRFIKV
jgi:DNA helicase-2/ATP-dependent DNA helicase PcrA